MVPSRPRDWAEWWCGRGATRTFGKFELKATAAVGLCGPGAEGGTGEQGAMGEVPERIGDGFRAGRDGGQQQAGVGLVAGGLGRRHPLLSQAGPSCEPSCQAELSADIPASGAVDVGGNVTLMPVTGRQRPGRLEHQDGAAG